MDSEALFKIQYGLYIVTTKLGEKINGQIATTVMQVANNPAKLMVGLSKDTYTYELLTQSKVFGISILEQDTPMSFIGNFGFIPSFKIKLALGARALSSGVYC
jgi:ferric-chelate reductase [NAD(P)H]